jgi:hypothetical protein
LPERVEPIKRKCDKKRDKKGQRKMESSHEEVMPSGTKSRGRKNNDFSNSTTSLMLYEEPLNRKKNEIKYPSKNISC